MFFADSLIKFALFFSLLTAGPAFAGEPAVKSEALIPAAIPTDRPALDELTAELRGKVRTLGLNGLPGVKGGKVSKALVLLPHDRGRAGLINFEIEAGSRAGVYQCEALGRGLTSTAPVAGWQRGMIGGTTIYYAPEDGSDGATVPGVYDLRNISPDLYEISILGRSDSPADDAAVPADTLGGKEPKPFFTAVWRSWYPAAGGIMPVDLIWAEDSQAGTQGEGVPFFERRSTPTSAASKARQAAQLSHNPRYYYGPHGRSGFAVHTDLWEEPSKQADPQYAGRPELSDFRWRDTFGCVKLRPGCLAPLNRFIAEQSALGRRVQLEVRETALLDEQP